MSYNLRRANLDDVEFISKVIIEAEKSGSNKIGMGNIFNLNEQELKTYLVRMLEEEIEGCEISINSFVIAEFMDEPVASFGGWIEGENEDDQPSAILKSNLLAYHLPKEKLTNLNQAKSILNNLLIERELHTHQLEYAFVDEKHRGNQLISRIVEKLLEIAKEKNPNVKKSQVQVFENNISAIKAYEKIGYKKAGRFESLHSEILDYLPWSVKLIMEKKL